MFKTEPTAKTFKRLMNFLLRFSGFVVIRVSLLFLLLNNVSGRKLETIFQCFVCHSTFMVKFMLFYNTRCTFAYAYASKR